MKMLCVLALSLVPLLVAAESTGVQALERKLAPLLTLSASFRQTVYAADGYPVQETTGEMKLARPGRVRWVSRPPYEQWVVADGKTLWIYDPDLQQVTIRPFVNDISSTPAVLFIGGAGQLASRFSVDTDHAGAVTRYILKPLQSDSRYTELVLSFDGDNPAAITMLDALGQRTEVTLSQVSLNVSIESKLFSFNPPQGTDVLRESGAP